MDEETQGTMDETTSQLNRRNERAARPARFAAETLLLRLPCGGELFANWRFPVEHDHIADEFDKGAHAFGGIGFYCPTGYVDIRPCPRLRHLGRLLAAEDRALDETAAAVKAAHGDAEGFDPDEVGSIDSFRMYSEKTLVGHALPFDGRHSGSRLRRFLAEKARKRREWGKCREDFPNDVVHAAESSTGGDALSPRHEVDPATDA